MCAPSHVYYRTRFWKNSVEKFFAIFLSKFRKCFFQSQALYWPCLRNSWSDWCESKGRSSDGNWVNYVTLTFDLTHDLNLGFLSSNFEFAVSQELLVWMMWNKKGSEFIHFITSKRCESFPYLLPISKQDSKYPVPLYIKNVLSVLHSNKYISENIL